MRRIFRSLGIEFHAFPRDMWLVEDKDHLMVIAAFRTRSDARNYLKTKNTKKYKYEAPTTPFYLKGEYRQGG